MVVSLNSRLESNKEEEMDTRMELVLRSRASRPFPPLPPRCSRPAFQPIPSGIFQLKKIPNARKSTTNKLETIGQSRPKSSLG